MSAELGLYFPHYGAGRAGLNLIKRFNDARLKLILSPGQESETIFAALCREVAQTNRPMKCSPPGHGANPTGDNVLTAHLNEFEGLCALIEENYTTNARTMPLYQFLQRLESLKEKFKRNAANPEPPHP